MADIAAVVIQTLQWVGAPVKRQFQYLCCFTRNITSLRNEANQLEDTTHDLQGKVDTAKNDSRVITRVVDAWLQNSNDIQIEKQGILDEVSNVESGCLKLGARFFLSRRAKKTSDRVRELRGQCNFQADDISQPGPPPAAKAVPSENSYEFKSRKQIEEDIMTTLGREDVNMIGICGMGGLGKTTMATRIRNRALKEHVFDEVVMVVVSRPIDKVKIQDEIGGSLSLKLEGECSEARVQKLYARLSDTKRTLVVLDDVWETLKLKDLGIPHRYKGCTILVTSRNRDVLSAMNVEKIFGMEVLSKEDSWFLFKERAGMCVDDTKLNSIAKDIVTECAGLPIALTTVGAMLKDDMDVSIWKDSLRQLKQCNPDIPDFIANVYNPLKLSYDFLGSKHKYVFLLCCLYPEDHDIPLEHLTYFCVGLRIFEEGIGNVEEARNWMRALKKVLKSRSLLLDSQKGDEYVRMHDVVRDVCIFIARQEGYIGDNDCSWLSSSHRSELPMGLAVSKLRLLFFRDQQLWEGKFTLENSFLEGIRDLSVICIERYSLVSLPHTTQMLRNLNILLLDSCWGVETLSVVGELVNLEILICRGCHSIEELPPEIKGLNRLKVLELTGCRKLQRIGRDIISSLVGLEELKMLMSFNKWEAEDREEKENAGLKEVETLSNLRSLEIEIEDLALATENIRLSSKVDRFTIRFKCESGRFESFFDEYLTKQKMCLNWDGATCLGHWIGMQLLKDTECLSLIGNGANNVDFTKLEKIRYLQLGRCESMKNVVTTSMDDGDGAIVFPSIDHLMLLELPILEEICDDRISSNFFQNLKILTLFDLPALKQLWKSSQNDLGKDFLPQLEVLQIRRCKMMEAVFLWKGEDGNENNSCHPITIIRFPKLKELVLWSLPNLISLCQGIEGIEFPLMRKIEIRRCGKMKGMVWNENISGGSSNNASTHALFCPQQVSFGCIKELEIDSNPFCSHTIDVSLFGLEKLTIYKCAGSLSLFTSSMAGNLVNLKELRIKECDEMVEVIKVDEEKGMSGDQRALLLFPKLDTLELRSLPNLLSFCKSKGIESIQFPELRRMDIIRCGKMKGMVANGLTSNDNNFGGSNNNAHTHLFCESQHVLFGCLKKLDTDRNPFSELEKLTIFGCHGILSLFTSSMAGNLVNLQRLEISECDEMVEVIKDDEEKGMSGGRQRALLFPKLDTLELRSLPKLVGFCELKCDVEFPLLREVEIHECPNMGSLGAPNLESFVTDLKNDFLLQLSFISLKKLLVEGNEKPLNCYQIHGSVFDRSKKLKIYEYEGSMSLFSSSITGNLVNLTTLTIEDCDKMVKVIEEKEEEKEKVVSGAQRTTILFPKLLKIKLLNLPELVRFCEWKCDVELPSLTKVVILDCHNMKSFTLGPLNTPKLESVEINRKLDVGGVKDLNGLVQQRYLSREEEDEAEEEEEEEDKDGGGDDNSSTI